MSVQTRFYCDDRDFPTFLLAKEASLMSSLVKNLAAVSSEARRVLIGLYCVQVS